MEFYQLGDETISMYRQKEGYAIEKKVHLPEVDWQRKLWLFCEEPDSSIAARVFAIISVICILVSVVNFCMETLPAFERPVCINVTNPAYTAALAAAGITTANGSCVCIKVCVNSRRVGLCGRGTQCPVCPDDRPTQVVQWSLRPRLKQSEY
jgi:hypothetical protein